jgi:hypothetical protein
MLKASDFGKGPTAKDVATKPIVETAKTSGRERTTGHAPVSPTTNKRNTLPTTGPKKVQTRAEAKRAKMTAKRAKKAEKRAAKVKRRAAKKKARFDRKAAKRAAKKR